MEGDNRVIAKGLATTVIQELLGVSNATTPTTSTNDAMTTTAPKIISDSKSMSTSSILLKQPVSWSVLYGPPMCEYTQASMFY